MSKISEFEMAVSALFSQQDASIAALQGDIEGLQAKIQELRDSPDISPEDQAALDAILAHIAAITAKLEALDGLTPPVGPNDDILALLTDYTAAGISKKLGPDYAHYHQVVETFPELYEPPLKPIQFGMGRQVWQLAGPESMVAGDFGSTDAQTLFASDTPLVITNDVADKGLGVNRVRIYEMSNGVFTEKPEKPWNTPMEPDPHSNGWIEKMHEGIGFPVATARGMGRWANCGLIAFSSGFIGTAGTATAWAPFRGLSLAPGKIPLSIAVTSQNEFGIVAVHDTATGKGQICVIALWGSWALQHEANPGNENVHDWAFPYPGAPSPAIICGMKVLGYVDLPFKFPTGISVVAERTQNRIENREGNAGLLVHYDLSKQEDRDFFGVGVDKNTNVFSKWAEAVVISKYEDKAVHVDLTALFAGYRTAYITTQEEFDQTLPAHPELDWEHRFGEGDNEWPPTFTGKPEWTPTVGAPIDIERPSAVLLSEHSEADVAIATEGGTLELYSRGLAGLVKSLPVGNNITCLTYDKHNNGIRSGGFWAVCRGDRKVCLVSDWGLSASVTKTLRHNILSDPVAAQVSDTHGIETGLLTVCDFNAKAIRNYRYTELYLATSTGERIPLPAGADFEHGGCLDVPGKPFDINGANVN